MINPVSYHRGGCNWLPHTGLQTRILVILTNEHRDFIDLIGLSRSRIIRNGFDLHTSCIAG